MTALQMLETKELLEILTMLQHRYEEFQAQGLRLDMSRGKPSPEQLDLSLGLLTCIDRTGYKSASGLDCRNYGGGVEGLAEARELLAGCFDVDPEEMIIAGNSSLALMHDVIVHALLRGVVGSTIPWSKLPTKFICPSPGYDRHFAICESYQIQMITVEMREDGPDMDRVEELVAGDETIKGIWCTPKYSNPTGITFSDRVVDRLASMETKAKDFRIFWDNAYAIHDLGEDQDRLKNILRVCEEAGRPDRVFIFGSTSKISFAGGGLAMAAGSKKNVEWFKKQLSIQTIGPDKLNQLRHVRFFRGFNGIKEHMKKHAAIIRPRFEMVLGILQRELEGKGIADWTRPNGGYFISLNTLDGCAQRVVAMAAEAGVELTPAGATFPYGKDPRDRNIRIAPSLPPLEELQKATELLAICIQLASIERILDERNQAPDLKVGLA